MILLLPPPLLCSATGINIYAGMWHILDCNTSGCSLFSIQSCHARSYQGAIGPMHLVSTPTILNHCHCYTHTHTHTHTFQTKGKLCICQGYGTNKGEVRCSAVCRDEHLSPSWSYLHSPRAHIPFPLLLVCSFVAWWNAGCHWLTEPNRVWAFISRNWMSRVFIHIEGDEK